MMILLTEIPDSFEITDSDVDEANTETNVIDEVDNKDDFIKIEERRNIHILLTQEILNYIFSNKCPSVFDTSLK